MSDDKLGIPFTYNGEWKVKAGKEWSYLNGSDHLTCVNKSISFEGFKKKIYQKLGLDPVCNEIRITALYPSIGKNTQQPPAVIYDDDSWFGFLCEKAEKIPVLLCVDSKELLSNERLGHVTPFDNIVDLNDDCMVDVTDDNNGIVSPSNVGHFVEHGEAENIPTRVNANPVMVTRRQRFDDMLDHTIHVASNARDYAVNGVPRITFTDLISSGPELLNNTQNTAQGSGPIVHSRNVFHSSGAEDISGRHLNGSEMGQGCSDLGDFRATLPAYKIPLCPRTWTISMEDENEISHGMCFVDKEDLISKIKVHALRNHYQTIIHRSAPYLYSLRCKLMENCTWKLVGRRLKGSSSQVFKITDYEGHHSCGLSRINNEHAQATPSVIGRLVRDNVIDLSGKFKARNIQVQIGAEFGIELTYDQCYRRLQESLRLIGGTPEQSYSKLESYFYMLKETNPDTLCDIDTDASGRFRYCFMSLGASQAGFKYCRPILCVDGTHLKTVYGGCLLVAVGVDADDHLFPLAVGVVDGESIAAWTYFLTHLKKVIGDRWDLHDLAFVSDRNQAIKSSLESVFPDAYHGICYVHLERNVNDKFTENLYCTVTLHNAAYTCNKREFINLFQRIKMKNSEVANYLEAAGFKYWARSEFPGTRYAIMTSNYAESFNNVLVEARKMNIANMFHIRKILQQWYHEQRELAYACESELAPKVEETVKEIVNKRKDFRLHAISINKFQVSNLDSLSVVDLQEVKCFCGKWQTYRLPCVYAAAAIAHRKLNIYDACSDYYKAVAYKRIYSGERYPVPHEKHWTVPDVIRRKCILPPIEKELVSGDRIRKGKKRGRRKTKRLPSKGERSNKSSISARVSRILRLARDKKCSKCNQPGHRRDKCPKVMAYT